MHVEGMANIHVCANNIQATLKVAVSSELKETMLISCDNLRKLHVIPADFPNAVLSVKQPNNLSHLKAKLLRLFDFERRSEPGTYEMQPNVNFPTGGRNPDLRHNGQTGSKTL